MEQRRRFHPVFIRGVDLGAEGAGAARFALRISAVSLAADGVVGHHVREREHALDEKMILAVALGAARLGEPVVHVDAVSRGDPLHHAVEHLFAVLGLVEPEVPEVVEQAERRAAWITAIGLFALAVYIVGDSAFAFLTRSRPEASWWGIGLAIAAAIAMPLLWRSKLRIARRIESAALKADAMCSVTCAYMAITLLVGLLLNKFFGWWWADPLAALALVYFIVKEGREALHEARTGETCCCGEEECS